MWQIESLAETEHVRAERTSCAASGAPTRGHRRPLNNGWQGPVAVERPHRPLLLEPAVLGGLPARFQRPAASQGRYQQLHRPRQPSADIASSTYRRHGHIPVQFVITLKAHGKTVLLPGPPLYDPHPYAQEPDQERPLAVTASGRYQYTGTRLSPTLTAATKKAF